MRKNFCFGGLGPDFTARMTRLVTFCLDGRRAYLAKSSDAEGGFVFFSPSTGIELLLSGILKFAFWARYFFAALWPYLMKCPTERRLGLYWTTLRQRDLDRIADVFLP